MDYKIVMDSAGDLLEMEQAEFSNVPLKILAGEREFVDDEQVYYAGSGQGGVVAPRADEVADYAGIVLLSTSPRPYYEVIYDQRINYGLVDRSDEEIYYLVSRTDTERKFLKDGEYLEIKEEDITKDIIFGRPTAFWKDFLQIDCAAYLKEVQKPVLILQGDTDYMIKKDVDFAAWQEEMADESYATLKSYEGLSFFFTESKGIFAGHYKEFDRPARVSANVIEDIGSWILNEGTLAE
jgi:pimeloyl-ACP methyl ester carboxylesterase